MRFLALLSLLVAHQQPPRNLAVVPAIVGPNVVIRVGYTLNGAPDSVFTRNTIPAEAHKRAATGTAATKDSFVVVRPAAGSTVSGQVCVQSKKGSKVSAEPCTPWTYTEDTPPPPPPTINGVTVDTTAGAPSGVLFVDTFATGGQAPDQNGVGWRGGNAGPNEMPVVLADALVPSGYSMAFPFQGNPDLADDAWSEKRFALPNTTEVFVCMIFGVPANYAHRAASPNNNKLLRIWDAVYDNSTVHVGMSTLRSSTGGSQMIVEFQKYATAGTGNWSTGPWNPVFKPGAVDTVGFYAKVASAPTASDGIIRVWWNGAKVYDRSDLPINKGSGFAGGNYFGNGYVLGWANSGFDQNTTIRLRKFVVAKQPVAC